MAPRSLSRFVTAAFFIAGCASLKPPLTGPADGGPPWIEVTSPHFVLETDGDPDDARQAIAELEHMEDLLGQVAFPETKPGGRAERPRTEVVMFRDKESYGSIGFGEFGTYTFVVPPGEPEAPPRVVMYGRFDIASRAMVQTALAHPYIRDSIGYAPPWLGRGLADYFGTMRIDGPKVIIGEAAPWFGFTTRTQWMHGIRADHPRVLIPVGQLLPVRTLMDLNKAQFDVAVEFDVQTEREQHAHFAGSWALVHMMLNGEPRWRERFGRFLEAMHGGAPWRRAWADAFADVPAEQLEAAYRAYLMQKDMTLRTTPFTLPPTPPSKDRAMTDTEVHTLWAKLLWWKRENYGRAEQELASASKNMPDAAGVLLARGLLYWKQDRLAEAEQSLEAAARGGADDARILAALLRVRERRSAREKTPLTGRPELVERLERVAGSALSLELVARERLRLKQPRAALSAAKRSVERDPACFSCLDALAAVSAALGDAAKAADFERRAIDIAPNAVQKTEYIARLKAYGADVSAPASGLEPVAPPPASGLAPVTPPAGATEVAPAPADKKP